MSLRQRQACGQGHNHCQEQDSKSKLRPHVPLSLGGVRSEHQKEDAFGFIKPSLGAGHLLGTGQECKLISNSHKSSSPLRRQVTRRHLLGSHNHIWRCHWLTFPMRKLKLRLTQSHQSKRLSLCSNLCLFGWIWGFATCGLDYSPNASHGWPQLAKGIKEKKLPVQRFT